MDEKPRVCTTKEESCLQHHKITNTTIITISSSSSIVTLCHGITAIANIIDIIIVTTLYAIA